MLGREQVRIFCVFVSAEARQYRFACLFAAIVEIRKYENMFS
jgi:hypothetical protein